MGKTRLTFAAGLILGVLLGLFGASLRTLHPSRSTLLSYTAPLLQSSPLTEEGSILVEVHVGSTGRIQDYRVFPHGRGSQALPSALKNKLIFTTFRPATLRGRPIGGTALLSLPKDAPGSFKLATHDSLNFHQVDVPASRQVTLAIPPNFRDNNGLSYPSRKD
jgi:hypothetical protein